MGDIHNLKYLQEILEKSKRSVLDRKGINGETKRIYNLSKAHQESLKKVFPNSKEIIQVCDLKEEPLEKLYIFDLLGTLVEAAFVLCPKSKDWGEKVKEYTKYIDVTFDERIKSVARNLETLIRNGDRVAIVTNYDHSEETWINQILHEIENAMEPDCKGKVQYYATEDGGIELGRASRKDPLIKWKRNKRKAYMDIVEKNPNCEITIVDDHPYSDLSFLLNDPRVESHLKIIIINDIKAYYSNHSKKYYIERMGESEEEAEKRSHEEDYVSIMYTSKNTNEDLADCFATSLCSYHHKQEDYLESTYRALLLSPNALSDEEKQSIGDFAYLQKEALLHSCCENERMFDYEVFNDENSYQAKSYKKYMNMYKKGTLMVAHFNDWWKLILPPKGILVKRKKNKKDVLI